MTTTAAALVARMARFEDAQEALDREIASLSAKIFAGNAEGLGESEMADLHEKRAIVVRIADKLTMDDTATIDAVLKAYPT